MLNCSVYYVDMSQMTLQQNRSSGLARRLEQMKPQLARALPGQFPPERMLRIVLTAVRKNPRLLECTEESFFGSIMICAQLGLEPETPLGHAYLIPRNIRRRDDDGNETRVTECTFQIGYQGQLELARRSGAVHGITAYVVRDGDKFDWELGLHPNLIHKPSMAGDRGIRPVTHVYAIAHMRQGPPMIEVMTKGQIDDHKKRYSRDDNHAWRSDWEAMALKTVLRKLWRYMPKSAVESFALVADEASERKDLEDTVDWNAAPLPAAQKPAPSLPATSEQVEEPEEPEEPPPPPPQSEPEQQPEPEPEQAESCSELCGSYLSQLSACISPDQLEAIAKAIAVSYTDGKINDRERAKLIDRYRKCRNGLREQENEG